MKKYDLIVVGASTTGSWFATQMAKLGFSVLMIEKSSRDGISRNYDVFHMAKAEMENFGFPIPEPGDIDYAFEFVGGAAYSAYGNYPKHTHTEVVGMHKHEYILRLNDNAVNDGVELVYEADFSGFIFDENGKIIGANYTTPDGEQSALASIVCDCTGIPSAARRALPDGYGVENFEITANDMFYVILYYVLYPEGHEKVIHTDSYLQYKCWSAPQPDENGGILGVGANLSFEYAEEMFREFRKNVPWCQYTVQKIEKGATPYRPSPYSVVADGFIAMGDAACTTKPNNGEGCTSALYLCEIAVDVISSALKEGGYLSKERLWSINKKYNDGQGKVFAAMRTMLIGAASLNNTENEYLFANDIGFSEKVFGALAGDGLDLGAADVIKMLKDIIKGVATSQIRLKFLGKLVGAAKNALEMLAHYSDYPETPDGFDEWVKKADELWAKVGSMSDNCNPEIIDRMNRRKENKIGTTVVTANQ